MNDPRELLHCPPQELNGQWSPDKWDYWLQSARAEGLLAADELALARQGIMVGECHGAATFHTAVDSRHLQTTFNQLAEKIHEQFPNAHIKLLFDENLMSMRNDTPYQRKNQRLAQAQAAAKSLILKSPVMHYLTEQGQGELVQIELHDP
ncbi:hypothetical protein [Psychrobacter ciconiae]|uniref:hypothetical protein n=1 Tax=Psychrobacter ciconiae TaxID=1553449 RepID=UPI0019192D1F|nr:hypothetical protein [Psychrobacter ciconiae]